MELCLDGQWGTVCDNFWSNLDAIVVCNQLSLGKTDAQALRASAFGAGSGLIHLNNFFCSGSESRLTDCPHAGVEEDDQCTHLQDASVICSGEFITQCSCLRVHHTMLLSVCPSHNVLLSAYPSHNGHCCLCVHVRCRTHLLQR